jgi:hypothetical protein
MYDRSKRSMPRLPRGKDGSPARVIDRVEEALDGLRYGEVTVIFQDGIIVQVERTDRLRLPRDTR